MTAFQLSEQEYMNLIKMDGGRKHLLVEGRSDTVFFGVLFEEFFGVEWKDKFNAEIDNAETLISSDGHARGNRQKIEEICRILCKPNLLGFVDREFRNFIVEGKLDDNMQSHYQEDNLIWSRGHSVENYYFEVGILRQAFQDICGDEFPNAIILFHKNINFYLQTACALSLLGLKYPDIKRERIEASLGWNIIAPTGGLDINAWKNSLSMYSGLKKEEIENIINIVPELIFLTKEAEIRTLRWLCHGHLGFAYLWHAFSRCIYDAIIGNEIAKKKSVQAFLQHHKTIGFKLCARAWAKAAFGRSTEYPSAILSYLGEL